MKTKNDANHVINTIDPTKIKCRSCHEWKDKETAVPFFTIDSLNDIVAGHIGSYRCKECNDGWMEGWKDTFNDLGI